MQNQRSIAESELVGATWTIEQLLLIGKHQMERSRIRRAVDEAADTFSTADPSDWQLWFIEACLSLGTTCRVIDASPDELVSLARDGVIIVIRTSDAGWNSFTVHRRSKFRLVTTTSVKRTEKISERRLRKMLQTDPSQNLIRCVVFEQTPLKMDTEMSSEHEGTPQVVAARRSHGKPVPVARIFYAGEFLWEPCLMSCF